MPEKKQRRVVTMGLDDNGWMGVNAISLVEFPAIEANFVYLSAAKKIKLSVDGERRMLYGPLLIPDQEILRIDDDGSEYYVKYPTEVIMQVAHQFLKKNNHHNSTLEHLFPLAGLCAVESWVKEFDSDKSNAWWDLPVGTWFVGLHIEDEAVLEEVKAGRVKGFSIEGLFMEAGASLSRLSAEHKLLHDLEQLLKEVE